MSSVPAVYVRGGTSKGLLFHRSDLPADRSEWDPILLRAMGSPDPYGRQLDGMGGGVSSTSKVCVIGPPTMPDADIDYTFAQVGISTASVNYTGNCGNMTAAVGPFAVDEGLVNGPTNGETVVRLHNTNTGKIIRSTFAVQDKRSVSTGDYALIGVPGTGSPVRLDFLAPGGAVTGQLLPAHGQPASTIVMDGQPVRVSMIDAANPVVLAHAGDLGLTGTETPEQLSDPQVLFPLLQLRRRASILMGISHTLAEATANPVTPFIGIVGPPVDYTSIRGETVAASSIDLSLRFLSSEQPHKAVPLTCALATAVAAQIPGTVVADLARRPEGVPLRLGTPSGAIQVLAAVTGDPTQPESLRADFASSYRTTRRLFTGAVEI